MSTRIKDSAVTPGPWAQSKQFFTSAPYTKKEVPLIGNAHSESRFAKKAPHLEILWPTGSAPRNAQLNAGLSPLQNIVSTSIKDVIIERAVSILLYRLRAFENLCASYATYIDFFISTPVAALYLLAWLALAIRHYKIVAKIGLPI